MTDVEPAAARLAQLASFYGAQPRPPVSPRRVQRIIAEIEAAIAPLGLPAELGELWQSWDPPTFEKLVPFPALIEPEAALAIWRRQRHPVGDVPAVLFPVAAQRSCYLQVELIHQDWAGPRVWFHAMADGEYELQATGLAGYLHQAADAIVAGLVELPSRGSPFLGSGRGDEWDLLVEASLERAGVPFDARQPQDWSSPDRWPAPFRLAQGLDPVTS
jgi:hypothetical protein